MMSEARQAFPVSYSQQRLWVLEQLTPGTAHYHLAGAVHISSPIDLQVFRRSLAEIVRRHESLRTGFQAVAGEPVQVVAAFADLAVDVTDVQGEPSSHQAQVERLITEEIRQPFDLSHPPLLRVKLLRTGSNHSVLVITMHHIISDAWSVGVFFRELNTLYKAYIRGEPSSLPELAIQYVDYAVWQREWLDSGTLQSQLEFWTERLRGLPLLEMPTDHARPAEPLFRGARLPLTISSESAGRLRSLCGEEGVTPFMALLAAFQVLLHRYSGQDEIVVGAPVAGRNRPELEDLIGFFVNTLVFRLDLSGNPTLRQVLHRVRKVALDAYEHQDVPFEKIVERLKPERDPSRNPLFQVTFQLLQSAQAPTTASASNLASATFDVDCGTAGFDLSVDMWVQGSGFGGRIEYSSELFERSTIERMAAHFSSMLDRLWASPDLRLSEFHLLSAEESQQFLAPFETPVTLPLVHERIRSQACLTPHALALVDGTNRFTYSDLDERVARTASRLRAAGCGPGVVAALYLPRGMALVVAILAVLETGSAYVALDPAYPAGRAAATLVDAGATVVVTTESDETSLPWDGAVVCVDMSGGAVPDRRPCSATADDLAYVVYTSGSTGTPNGCEIPHRALSNHCAAMSQCYGLSPTDRVLQFASPSFDVVAEEVFPTLASGATVCVLPAGVALTFDGFTNSLLDNGITVANLPADYWHAWVSFLRESHSPVPSPLRLLIVGSASVGAQQMRQWMQIAPPHVRVMNAYGISEAAVTSTIFEVPAGLEFRDNVSVPIGRPISNVQAYVLDRYRQPVPPGVPGELCIAGAGLARGYLNRPGLTAERFIEQFLPGVGPVRLYRTGDRARFRSDGNLEWLGRLDNQISVRGFRVEPEEVEAILALHPAVERVAVVDVREDHGELRLVAYVVGRPPDGISVDHLRSFAAERLPSYMAPSLFVAVDTLPSTANGKIDRVDLRARPLPARSREIADSALPTTAAEQKLAEIWKEMLGIPHIGIRDNFFELGGDSIMSIRIMSRANQAGLRLNPIQIFQHQTIAELALVAGTAAPARNGHVLHGALFTLTPVQQWLLDQDLPNVHHYNQAAILELSGRIDAAALERALGELMVHHDALRLRFNREGGSWLQRYEGAAEKAALAFEDVQSLPATDATARIATIATQTQASMNLSEGPLLRAVLLHLPGERFRLLIVIHHLCVDGVSWRVLMEDLQSLYAQAVRGEAFHLPPKTTSFQEWALRLKETAGASAIMAELGRYLALPYNRIRPLPIDYAGGNTVASESAVSIELSSESTGNLLRYAPAAYRADINDLLLTALVLSLSEWSGNTVQLVDVEGHGREPLFSDVDLSRTVGWFTAICPRVLDVGSAAEPLTTLRSVKEQLRAFPNRGIGYGLLRYLCPDRQCRDALAALPRAQVSFNYMGQFERSSDGSQGSLRNAGSCGPLRDTAQPRGYLLELNGHIADGRLGFEWTFSREIHSRATVQAVADSFASKLDALSDSKEHALASAYTPSDFPLANLNQKQLEKLIRNMADKR